MTQAQVSSSVEVSPEDEQRGRIFDLFRRWGYLQADLDPLGHFPRLDYPELRVSGADADQEGPDGWLGVKNHPDVPALTNLRLDPLERAGWPTDLTKGGSQKYFDWFLYEFWRFVFVQQQVAKLAQTAIDYPPMQHGASFNLDALKAELAKKMEEAQKRTTGD